MIFLVALLAWTPAWGAGTVQGWVDTSCAHDAFNGARWTPYYDEPGNRFVIVERHGQTVRVELWSHEPRELVAESTTACGD
jgi:hypothetical protein